MLLSTGKRSMSITLICTVRGSALCTCAPTVWVSMELKVTVYWPEVPKPGVQEKVAETGMVVAHSHSNDPLPCNAAIASIEVILEEGLVDVARKIGEYWRGHLETLAQRHELIGDIRGRGLLQGVEFVTERATRNPAYEAGRNIGRWCLENGLIVSVRRGGSVIRFVPPFTTTEDQMDLAAEILDHAITSAV